MSERPDWAADIELYQVLKDAMFGLAAGKGGFGDRLEPFIHRLEQVCADRYPIGLSRHIDALFTVVDNVTARAFGHALEGDNLTPAERDEVTVNIMVLFEAMVEDRGKLPSFLALRRASAKAMKLAVVA